MTTDLLDLARRTMDGSLGLVGGGQATPPGDDHPVPDVRTVLPVRSHPALVEATSSPSPAASGRAMPPTPAAR